MPVETIGRLMLESFQVTCEVLVDNKLLVRSNLVYLSAV